MGFALLLFVQAKRGKNTALCKNRWNYFDYHNCILLLHHLTLSNASNLFACFAGGLPGRRAHLTFLMYRSLFLFLFVRFTWQPRVSFSHLSLRLSSSLARVS